MNNTRKPYFTCRCSYNRGAGTTATTKQKEPRITRNTRMAAGSELRVAGGGRDRKSVGGSRLFAPCFPLFTIHYSLSTNSPPATRMPCRGSRTHSYPRIATPRTRAKLSKNNPRQMRGEERRVERKEQLFSPQPTVRMRTP